MAFALRSEIISIDPSVVPELVAEKYVAQFVQLATVTVLAYDTITTMDKEVKYFWKGPWRGVNAVYFANRYTGLFGAAAFLFWNSYGVDLTKCNFAHWSRGISDCINVILIDYILMIRVLALYSKDRALSIFLKTLLVLEAAIKIALIVYLTLSEHVALGGLDKHVTICGADGYIPWTWGVVHWALPLGYAIILLVLALYKAAEYWRMSAGFKGFTLVKVLIQDQLLYFLFVLVCSVVNIIQIKVIVSDDFPVLILLQSFANPPFLCVLGSRLLVNLKEAGELGLNQGTNYRASSQTMSGMEFAGGNVEGSGGGN